MAEWTGKMKSFLSENRKWVYGIIGALVVLGLLHAGFEALYTVEGVVTKVKAKQVTVTNFWGTSTLQLDQAVVSGTPIKVGDRIHAMKNLSGKIYLIRTDDGRYHRGFGPGRDMMRGPWNGCGRFEPDGRDGFGPRNNGNRFAPNAAQPAPNAAQPAPQNGAANQ